MGRKRFIYRGEAGVWCPGGRWGPRRTRVTECCGVIRAEDLYTALILDANGIKARPGTVGSATFRMGEQDVTVDWELRSNAVWRCGRLFLRCRRCSHRCTRLYLPLSDSGLACRKCYGLSYNSRTLNNYKNSLWGRGAFARMFMTTQRDWAYTTTDEARQSRREASFERWDKRRPALAARRALVALGEQSLK